jgi:hypothetical protein
MDKSSFLIISKQDGSIVKDIKINIKGKKIPGLRTGGGRIFIYTTVPNIIPYDNSWVLTEHSADTVFRLLPDYSMIPFIVRTPSIQPMNFEDEILLFLEMITDRYLFMKTQIKEIDSDGRVGMPLTKANLAYDKQEKRMYEYTVYNNDFSTKTPFAMSHTLPISFYNAVINNEIAFWQRLEANELIEARDKGQLNGKLKEAAAKLEKESNPVIMLVKYK